MAPKSLEPQLPRDQQKQRSRELAIDLFLMGIIAANPPNDQKDTNTKRLARAREALFGDKNKRGRKSTRDLVGMFPMFAELFKSDRDKSTRLVKRFQTPEVQAEWDAKLAEAELSLRGLAKKYGPQFEKKMTKIESTEDRLRREMANSSPTAQDIADLEGYYHGNSPKAGLLKGIFEDLNGLGIECRYPVGIQTDQLTLGQNGSSWDK